MRSMKLNALQTNPSLRLLTFVSSREDDSDRRHRSGLAHGSAELRRLLLDQPCHKVNAGGRISPRDDASGARPP
jgi:hypothetical protein